jgi:hypothetical protein
MSTREFKVGNRVRVSLRNRMANYQPGDKGTVLRIVRANPTGARYYAVVMDKDQPMKSGVIFTEGEIELDA